jgi:transcriptional regulator with GAF, ATPase, and Fis domain
LRVLQEGEVHRLGATNPVKVDVRIIAATHRDLSAMVEDEAFREDLYYRLAVVVLRIPPLRERREDIPEMIDTLFQRAKERHGLLDVRMASAVHQRLIAYSWPGNVRQLENVFGAPAGSLLRRSDNRGGFARGSNPFLRGHSHPLAEPARRRH